MKGIINSIIAVAVALSAFAAVAQTTTTPIDSPWNIVDPAIVTQVSIAPAGLKAPSVPVSFTLLQQTVSVTLPGQPAGYTLTGIDTTVSQQGTNLTTVQPMIYRFTLSTPVTVPAGVNANLTVTWPLSGNGSLSVALGPDQISPSAPTGLIASAQGTSQISVVWFQSNDNVGIASYYVERCQGVSCVDFAQIAAPTVLQYLDATVTPATTYSYRVRASDVAGNMSAYSNIGTATTQALAPPPPPPSASTPSAPGSCTAPAAVAGCAAPLQQLADSFGATWTLVAGVPFRNGVKTNNPYAPSIKYLYVNSGAPDTIRSQNNNGTYACVKPTGTATVTWAGSGC